MARRDEGDREVTVIETDGGPSAGWFLLGAAFGAGMGLLFAPQSGRRTRRDIRRRAVELREEATEHWDELVDDVEEKGKRLKASAEELAGDVRDEVKKGRRKIRSRARSARDDLEQRLEDARSRRRPVAAADGVADLSDDDFDEGED